MLRHVILFRFYKTVAEEERVAAVSALKELGSKIPEVLDWSVGVSRHGAPSEHYDVAQVSSFASREELARYRENPEHVRIRDMFSRIADWVVVDYET